MTTNTTEPEALRENLRKEAIQCGIEMARREAFARKGDGSYSGQELATLLAAAYECGAEQHVLKQHLQQRPAQQEVGAEKALEEWNKTPPVYLTVPTAPQAVPVNTQLLDALKEAREWQSYHVEDDEENRGAAKAVLNRIDAAIKAAAETKGK